MLAAILALVSKHTTPGISTKALADIAAAELRRLGGSPTFLGHEGFPDVICISVNEQIVHGIPSLQRILMDGDIVGLDFGVTYRGMMTDAAISVIAGQPRKPVHEQLLKDTERSLQAGIAVVRDKVRVGDIGAAVESSLRPKGYGIPRDLVGHGIGRHLWEEPNIPNYGKPHTGLRLDAGMTIAIEPMVTLGTDRICVADDGWTLSTTDGSWAAHFEHTVLILDDGAEILTKQ